MSKSRRWLEILATALIEIWRALRKTRVVSPTCSSATHRAAASSSFPRIRHESDGSLSLNEVCKWAKTINNRPPTKLLVGM